VTLDELRSAKNQQPFRPFAIHTTDGRRVEVMSPYAIVWGPDHSRTVVVVTSWKGYEMMDLGQITSLYFPASPAAEGNGG
jgi:hypothetical protein